MKISGFINFITKLWQTILVKYFLQSCLILTILTVIGYVITFAWVFCYLPDDITQGNLVKIMYIHVPCAWLSLSSYIILGICSVLSLLYNDKVYSILTKVTTIISLHTCFITLLTGMIWGKAAWGTWWLWDPRLTAVFIQFCLLVICYMLRNVSDMNSTLEQASDLVTVIGLINMPIIKFAVNAWNSIHQDSSVLRFDGVKIHPDLLYPLLISFISILCFYLLVGIIMAKNSLDDLKIQKLIRRYL